MIDLTWLYVAVIYWMIFMNFGNLRQTSLCSGQFVLQMTHLCYRIYMYLDSIQSMSMSISQTLKNLKTNKLCLTWNSKWDRMLRKGKHSCQAIYIHNVQNPIENEIKMELLDVKYTQDHFWYYFILINSNVMNASISLGL